MDILTTSALRSKTGVFSTPQALGDATVLKRVFHNFSL